MKVLHIGLRVFAIRLVGDSRSTQQLYILMGFVTPVLILCRLHSFSWHHFQSHNIYGPLWRGNNNPVDNRFHSSCVTMFDDRFFRGDFLKIRSQSSIVTRLTKKKSLS